MKACGKSPQVVIDRSTYNMTRHLHPLYITTKIVGKLVSRLLLDNEAYINIMTLSTLKKLGRDETDHILTDVVMTDFTSKTTRSLDVLPTDITVGSSMMMSTFFVMYTTSNYNVLLEQVWILTNSYISFTLHQLLIFWDMDGVRIAKVDECPFKRDTNIAEALLYCKKMGPIQPLGADKMGKPIMTTLILSTKVTKEFHRLVILEINQLIIHMMNIPIMSDEPAKGQHLPMTSGENGSIFGSHSIMP